MIMSLFAGARAARFAAVLFGALALGACAQTPTTDANAGFGAGGAATARVASCFVTRPPGPVPWMPAGATPASPSTRAAAGITRCGPPGWAGGWTDPIVVRPSVRFTSTTGAAGDGAAAGAAGTAAPAPAGSR